MDYLKLIKENGLPIILLHKGEATNEMAFATEDCDKEVDFAGPGFPPDPKVVCKWCGQIKEEFIKATGEFPFKGTKTSGLIPIIDPNYQAGFLDSVGNRVWGRCPHVKAWQGKTKGKTSFR